MNFDGRSRRLSDGGLVVLIVALLVPPVVNVFYFEISGYFREPDTEIVEKLRRAERELAIYREEVRIARAAESVQSLWNEAYEPRRVRVLPVGDLSPLRHSFWVAPRAGQRLEGKESFGSWLLPATFF